MDIAIFGTGRVSRTLLSYPLQKNCRIVIVCDNNSNKWKDSFMGYLVESPKKLLKIPFDYILIATASGFFDIWEQIIRMGIPVKKIVFPYGWDSLVYSKSPLDQFFLVDKCSLIPFNKSPAEIYRQYKGETSRARERRIREGFFEKYCVGEGLDIGYGADPLLPNIAGWDLRNGDAQYLHGIEDESFDFVYSSHCLEHMRDVRVALRNWFRVVKQGGYLILAVPHRNLYEKRKTLPSRWNFDHKHMFLLGKKEQPDTLDVVEEIRESLENYDIKYVKTCDEGHTITNPLVHSDGEYQIEAVVQKI